jgi:hypothetical protein
MNPTALLPFAVPLFQACAEALANRSLAIV